MGDRAAVKANIVGSRVDDDTLADILIVANYHEETLSSAIRRLIEIGLEAWHDS